MPDKVLYSPNERVDIPDMLRSSSGYTSEMVGYHLQRVVLGDRGYVLDGFRVQVINGVGTASVEIFNGNAADLNGTILNNEANPSYSVPIPLVGANTTFYLELELAEDATNDDSRAFWDATIVNTPPIPNGQEYQATVPTRTSMTWRIVTPVDTTGFAWSLTTPTSTRVPLVRLRTDASNNITVAENPGLALVNPASVLIQDYPGVANQLVVADAQLFSEISGSEQITLDPDNVTPTGTSLANVLSVDRVNNIITLSAPAGVYPTGTVVRATGVGPVLVAERTDGGVPTDPSSHPDNTRRLWKGDETRGTGLMVSKEDATDRDDLNLRNLKSYVDFVAGQIREMKWGAPLVGDDEAQDSRIPPQTWDLVNNPPRYFSKTRGIQGAGTYAVTIGDGVTSYGDFNGTDTAVFQAAVDAAGDGDTIFVKAGNYVLTTSIQVTKSLNFVGDGANSYITGAVNTGLFVVTTAENVSFRFLRLENTHLLEWCVFFDAASTNDVCAVEFCNLSGTVVYDGLSPAIELLRIRNCTITTTANLQTCLGNFTGGSLTVQRAIVENCEFVTTGNATTLLRFGVCSQLTWNSNHWVCTDVSGNGIAGSIAVQGIGATLLDFRNHVTVCGGTHAARLLELSSVSFVTSGLVDNVKLFNGAARYSDTGGQDSAINVANFSTLTVRAVTCVSEVASFSSTGSYVFMQLGHDAATLVNDPVLNVTECVVVFNDTNNGVFLNLSDGTANTTPIFATIRDCVINNAYAGIVSTSSGSLTIDSCFIDGESNAVNSGYGIVTGNATADTTLDVTVTNTIIQNMLHSSAVDVAGIWILSPIGTAVTAKTNLQVSNCFIRNIGDNTSGALLTAYGVNCAETSSMDRIDIQHSSIRSVSCPGNGLAYGIGIFSTLEDTADPAYGGIHLLGNYIQDIGAFTNFAFGIGVLRGAGGIEPIVNVHMSDNSIDVASTSTANYGIICRTFSNISRCRLADNIVRVSSASSLFGAGIQVEAANMGGVKIEGTYFFGGSVAGPGIGIAVVSNDTTNGGLFTNIDVSQNYLLGGNGAATTLGTLYGIVFVGVAGVGPGSFTEWEYANVTENYILNFQGASTATPFPQINLTGYFRDLHVSNNTTISEEPNPAVHHIWINGVDSTECERVTVSNNTCVGPNASITYTDAAIKLNEVSMFTITGNVVDLFNSPSVPGTGVVLHCEGACTDGTIVGNILRGSLANTDVLFSGSCERILAIGNNFAGVTGVVSGAAPANDVVFNAGDGTAVDGVGPLNLTL